ncbi:MAG: MFS transporter, partial [Paracoccus sp. (in: a-proteobacteria)]|nr:MFS transporter [Paracoccus sp. (in: a-proteobacteria)]
TLTILSNATISPALPGLEASFAGHENAAHLVRLLVTAPALAVAIIAPFAGIITDRFSRRRLLIAGIVLYAIAGTLGAVLPTLEGILISRLVLGLSVAAIMTAQTALIGDYFSGADRGRFIGWQMAATNFGGFVFILLAGWLATISPRWPFALYAVGFLYLPFIALVLRERPVASPGHAAAPPADAPVPPGWAGRVAVLAFLSGMTFVMFYIVPVHLPFYLASIGLPDPSVTAQLMAATTAAGGATALFFGRVRARLGGRITPAAGYVLVALGFGAMAGASGFAGLVLANAVLGIGLGLVMPNFMTAALNTAPAQRRGAVSGAMTAAIFTGQFLSPLLTGPLFDAMGYPGGFRLVAVAALIFAALAALVLAER